MTRAVKESAKRFRRSKRPGSPARRAGKRATNVSIDAEILAAARLLNINLSRTLEDALRRRVEDVRVEKWQHENKAMFDFVNRYVERNGTMSEALLDLDDPAV